MKGDPFGVLALRDEVMTAAEYAHPDLMDACVHSATNAGDGEGAHVRVDGTLNAHRRPRSVDQCGRPSCRRFG